MLERIIEEAKKIMLMFAEETGEKWENGDSVAAVYNDCTFIVSVVDDQLKFDIIAGEPYKFDKNLLDGGANG